MADTFRPMTLLLGAVCLWALAVLILALAGLGSRFPATTGAAKPPPLPNVSLTRSQSRLGPITDYLEVGARPLMTIDRRPAPQMAVGGEAGAAELDVVLTSVLIAPKLQLAILTDNKDGSSRRVRVGETIQGSNWRLVQLEPRRAVIEGPTGQRTLDLRVFDGKDGEMPTPAVAGAGTQPPPAAPQKVDPQPSAKPEQPAQSAAPVTQDEQIEAIRRRIEARRAQMRAEAESAGAKDK